MSEAEKPAGGSLPSEKPPAAGLAKNTVFNLFGYAFPLLVGFVFLPFIIRGFGTARFGVLSLLLIVLGNFGFLDLGLGRATIRYVADAIGRGAPQEIPEYLWTTVILQLGLSLLGTALLILAAPLLVTKILVIPAALQAEALAAFTLTAFSLPVIMVSASFRGVLEAAQRFDLVNIVRVPSSSANYLVPVLALLVWKSLIGIVVLLFVFRTLTLLVWIVLGLREFPILRRRPTFVVGRLGPLLSYGGWATVSSLVGSLLENLDRFAIGAFLSVQAVAFYSAPYEAVGRLGILPSSLVMALFPTFSVLQGSGAHDRIRTLFARSVKAVTVAGGAFVVLIILLSRTILRVWLGAEFAAKSGLVFQLIAASFLFLSFTYVAFSLLQGVGRTDLPARIHLFLLAAYLPMLWAGIKLAGIQGVAAAWLVHLGLQAFLLFRAARRLGYTDVRSLLEVGMARALAGLAVFAAAGGGLSLLMPAPAAAAIAAVVCAPILWFWVLSREERAWLRDHLRKALGAVRKSRPCPKARPSRGTRPRLLLVGLVPPEAGGYLSCGVASHVLELARQACDRGYETSILAPLRPGAKPCLSGIRLLDASRSRPSRLWSGGRAALRRGGGPAFFGACGWRDRVSVLSWTERIRAAIAVTGADIVHIHPLSHPAGPGLAELPQGIPVVFTDHGFWQDLYDENDLRMIREAARLATAVVSVSRYCLDRQDDLGLVFAGTREVIPNAMTPVAVEALRERPQRDRRRVLFVAGVESVVRKGLDILIRAFAGSPALKAGAELVVITEQDTAPWAAASMTAEGIAGEVLPLRPHTEMPAAYAEADVLVLPSRSEAFGLVLLESLAVGTPVVGFAPTVVELRAKLGEEIGLPFDAGSETPAALAEKILDQLARPIDRAALAARTAAAFSWETIFPAFDSLYRRLGGS